MTKADLLDLLIDVDDNEEIYFIDKSNLQYSISANAYMNSNGIFIKEDLQLGYTEGDVIKFFDNH